jgi:hypothetical protein
MRGKVHGEDGTVTEGERVGLQHRKKIPVRPEPAVQQHHGSAGPFADNLDVQ